MRARVAILGCVVLAGAGCDLVLGLDNPTPGSGGSGATGGGGSGATAGSAGSSGSTGTTGGGGSGATGGGGSGTGGGACTAGEKKACYSGAAGTMGVGACKGGEQTCKEDGSGFGPCEGEVVPGEEVCHNEVDEDCDGNACAMPLGSILWGDAEDQIVLDAVNDPAGNVVVGGKFLGQLKFIQTLTAGPTKSGFLVRLDPDGIPVWSMATGSMGDIGTLALGSDLDGEIALAGSFTGSMLFGQNSLTGNATGYVARVSKDGAGLWGRTLNCSPYARPHSVGLSAAGVVIAGDFQCNLDLGAGALSSQAGFDVLVALLTGASEPATWSKQFGNVSYQTAFATARSSASTWVAGTYQGTVDFGGNMLMGGSDNSLFLLSLGANGSVQKAQGFAGAHQRQAMRVDHEDNIVLAGWFSGSTNLTGDMLSGGAGSVFVAKYTNQMMPIWSIRLGGLNFLPIGANLVEPISLAVDSKDNILVAFGGSGVADFGGGELGQSGENSQFLVKLAGDGSHLWSKRFGPLLTAEGCMVAVGGGDSPTLACGAKADTMDFGSGTLTGKGGFDVVVARFAP